MSLTKISLFVFLLFIGCNSKNEKSENDLKLLAKVDSLINENRKLNEQLAKISPSLPPNRIPEKDYNEASESKYVFVVLQIVVKNGYVNIGGDMLPNLELRNVCSPIKTISSYNENVKYQFMDEFQTNYMNRTMETTLKKRECFAFESYEEASKEREKYLIPKE